MCRHMAFITVLVWHLVAYRYVSPNLSLPTTLTCVTPLSPMSTSVLGQTAAVHATRSATAIFAISHELSNPYHLRRSDCFSHPVPFSF